MQDLISEYSKTKRLINIFMQVDQNVDVALQGEYEERTAHNLEMLLPAH
jgi:hypothetical protein